MNSPDDKLQNRKAKLLYNLLIDIAGNSNTPHELSCKNYIELRNSFINNKYLPEDLYTNINLNQYHSFLKNKYKSYKERKDHVSTTFQKFLKSFENDALLNPTKHFDNYLIDSNYIFEEIDKAINKYNNDDLDGALTTSRTILENVCKFILRNENQNFKHSISFPELSNLVIKYLNIGNIKISENNEFSEKINQNFSSILIGISNLRNYLGDAHGSSQDKINLKKYEVRLVVDIAGSMALFLYEYYHNSYNKKLPF